LGCPFAREIVTGFLKELAEHKYSRIASHLGTSVPYVSRAHDFIKQRLNPYPAQGFSNIGPGTSRNNPSGILPDVLISHGEHGFEVEVVESKRFFLRVSPMYQRLSADLDSEPGRYSVDEKKHIQHYVSRAKLFIANINQRRQTLQKITEHTVQAQQEFLEKGIRFLKPLTRASVANALGMHESTVSRATASKFVMLPNGRVIPYSDFFQAALSVMDVIREMIDTEDAPMTDHEISTRLADTGIVVACRTVAKYREQLGILPSSLR
jgi:RNA polymerase sigma-54 factor